MRAPSARAWPRRPPAGRCPRRGSSRSSPTSLPRARRRRSSAAISAARPSASPSTRCASRGDATRPWRALINLQSRDGERLDGERIRSAVADVPGARVVAVKAELDAIYARFLAAAEWQAALGAVAVLGLLALRLKSASRLVAVALPVAAATLVVLAALTLAGAALGILHLVGLLLTVAIGSNYALFFDHLREQAEVDSDTLASLLLANLTTVASFALLATSHIPVLQAVGIVVAPGAFLCLVFSAALLGRRGVVPRRRGAWENRHVTTTPGDGLLATSGTPPAAAPAAATAWPGYVKASVAWHLAAGAAAAIVPASWPWALGAVAANHLVLTAGGLWPRSRWLGSNWTRLPADAAARGEIAITIDDGPDPELTPAILDLLDRAPGARHLLLHRRARACPSGALPGDRRPRPQRREPQRSAPHRFSLLGPRAMAREIAAAQASLADITGVAPRFFRAPAGLRNPFLAPVLQRLDLQLVSWTRRGFDTVGNDPAPVLARLVRRLGAGDILLLHDGHGGPRPSRPCARAARPAGAARARPDRRAVAGDAAGRPVGRGRRGARGEA